ncbi:MAG: ATP-binding protein [Erysipelotrichaceae bacterium]|nr:ATP-binding protein [Erysipelotrichaceae bacterium]
MNSIDLIKKDNYLDAFIKKHNLTDEYVNSHINVFMRVYESRNKCINCKGLYCCSQASVGQRLDISYEQILLEEIEYCDYYLAKQKDVSLTNSYVYSDISDQLIGNDLDNIQLFDDEKGLFIELYDILDGKSNKGIYVCGEMGVGKTYLVSALANSLVKKHKKVAFVKVSSFINEMRRLVGNDTIMFDKYMNDLKNVDYLFLDDIGSESVSTFSRDDILFTILDYRMENNLTTIFTSNLNKQDLVKHYTFDKKDNSSILRAKRLVERIDVLSNDYTIIGQNKRRQTC